MSTVLAYIYTQNMHHKVIFDQLLVLVENCLKHNLFQVATMKDSWTQTSVSGHTRLRLYYSSHHSVSDSSKEKTGP